MATVVSLTQTKIEELMAGWEGVSLSQDQINAIVSQLWTDVGSQGAVLEDFNEVVVPDLLAQTDAAKVALDDFVTNTVPTLEADISANGASIENLNTVTMPLLEDRVHTNELWIIDLNETILPELYTQLDANNVLITDFNTVTLPDLNARLDAVEGGTSFDPTELQAAIDALEGKFPVEGDDIAADAVTANNIAAHTITALEIAADTITANEIAADAITANEIAAHTITAAEIFADTITANEIATDTITANEIAADAITANEIAAHTITAAEIFADTITANEIAADTITANEIAADAITANEIAGHTITAAEIAADTITANEMAADSITTNELAAGAVTAENIFAGAVTTDALFAGAVTAEKVSSEILIANEVFSRAGYFGDIEADQIQSGSMNAEIGVLGLLQVGQITISPIDGISVPGPNGLTLLSASGVGHRFAGAVDTDEVTINGGLIVNAENNTINGKIKLSNVVVKPTKAPAATRYWPYTAPTGTDVLGLTDSHDGTKWVTLNITPSHRVRSYNKVTGALVDNFAEAEWSNNYVVYSITRAGNYYFMNCWKKDAAEWWLCRVGTSFGSFSALTRIASINTIGTIAVGRNEINGNPLAAWQSSAGDTITVREYNTAGDQQSSITLNTMDLDGVTNWTVGNGFLMSIGRGLVGYDNSDQYWVVAGSSVRFFDATLKTIKWWPGGPESPKGVCVEQGTTNKMRFLGYNTYRVYEWVREANWGANVTNPVDIAYSWYDSKVAGTGKHETEIGPVLHFPDAWRWSALQIDTASPSNTGKDDSPDSIALYINNQRQPDLPVGKVSNVLRGYVASGTPPKAANEFSGAAAYPGSLISEATFIDGISPRVQIRGDGTGNWGDLTVDGFGKAVIGGDTGWIAVTAFTNQWENYGSSYAPVGYRKIGNRVWLRGLIRGPGGLGGSMFTLPEGFRPPYRQIMAAVMTQVSDGFSATGENSPTFSSGSSGTGTSGTGHTHNINIPTLDVQTTVTFTNIAGRVDIDITGTVSHSGGATWQGSSEWVSLEGISFLIN